MAGVSDKNAFKAGLFILASVALAFVIIYLVAGRGGGGGQERTIIFQLADDISGLGAGSEVRVGGRTVGTVTKVAFADEYSHIEVDVSLPSDLPLREGAAARIQTSVTGIVWLNVSSLGSGATLADDATIKGDAGTLSDVVQLAADLGPSLKDLLDTANDGTLPSANRALAQLADAAQSLEELIGDDATKADFQQTLANLRESSDRFPKLTADVESLVGQATDAVSDVSLTVTETGDSLSRVLTRAETVADDVAGAARGAKAAVDDTRVAVNEVQGIISRNRGPVGQIVERLSSTARTLDLAGSEIRRSPWRLLYRPDGRQRDSMNLYDAARRFAEGANALQDAAIALEGATVDPAAESAEVRALLDAVQARFDEYRLAEEALFEKIAE